MLTDIIEAIDREIAALQQAKDALTGISAPVKRGPGRPPLSASKGSPKPKRAKRKGLSPEAKEKIRQAQLKRWAKQKGATPSEPKAEKKAPAKKSKKGTA